MKSVILAVALAAFVQLGNAVPTRNSYALHEKRTVVPRLWNRGERVDREAVLPIRIGLTQNNLEIGEDLLMDV
jgi:tripeptidyl-peptidase-1